MAHVIVMNEHELTRDQLDVVTMLTAQAEKVEAWPEPEFSKPSVMGLSFTEDGLTMVGYFDASGTIIGDWLC